MANFNPTIITDSGLSLIAKISSGSGQMRFTRICTSKSSYSVDKAQHLSALTTVEQETTIDKVEIINDTAVKVSAVITNKLLASGYYINAIGLYAEDPDLGEILYSITIAKVPDWMQPDSGSGVSSLLIQLITQVSNSSIVKTELNPSVLATVQDLLDHTDNADIHVTAKEKAAWNNKAEFSDIPTTLPANGGNADTVNGKSSTDIMNMGNSIRSRTRINDGADLDTMFSGGKFYATSSTSSATILHTPFPESGFYLDVFGTGVGSGITTQVAMKWSGAVKIRYYDGSTWSDWALINDGGNAATVNGHRVLSDIPANAEFTDSKVTNNLNSGIKAFLTGTASEISNTGTQVFDTGVYLDTTPGRIGAKYIKIDSGGTLQSVGFKDGNEAVISMLRMEPGDELTNATINIGVSGLVLKLLGKSFTIGTAEFTDSGKSYSGTSANALALNGKSDSDFAAKSHTHTPASLGAATSAQGAKADSAVQTIKIGGTAQTKSADGSVNLPAYPTTLPANGGNAQTVNNHTVNSDVPAGAVFTDTTYKAATASESGLMSMADKQRLDDIPISIGRNISDFYGICAGYHAISFNWAAVEGAGGYYIQKQIDGVWTRVISNTTNLQAVVTADILPDTEYKFRLVVLTSPTMISEPVTIKTPKLVNFACAAPSFRPLFSGSAEASLSDIPSGAWYGQY